MNEPAFIAQTFDNEHTHNPEAAKAWLAKAHADAKAAGCTYGRTTCTDDISGFLYEGWLKRPKDEGAQRWSVTSKAVADAITSRSVLDKVKAQIEDMQNAGERKQ